MGSPRAIGWASLLCSLLLPGVSLLAGCGGAAPLPPRAAELNRLGLVALESGDLATAEARFAVALEYHPRFVEALVNLGLTELARGNHAHARALFLRARRLNADLPHPHHALGVLADRQGKRADASGHYREALRVDPGFVPARANLARDYFDAGMLDDAREQFLRLAEVAPHDDRGAAGLAETLIKMGRRDEAAAVIASARKRLGDMPSLALLGARRALEEGDVVGAREALSRLSEARSAVSASAAAWLAIADLAAGDADAAVLHAEQALAEDRHEPVATFAMAEALQAKGDPGAAAWQARARAGASGGGR
jgi:Flp pilus assembly protein TadD